MGGVVGGEAGRRGSSVRAKSSAGVRRASTSSVTGTVPIARLRTVTATAPLAAVKSRRKEESMPWKVTAPRPAATRSRTWSRSSPTDGTIIMP